MTTWEAIRRLAFNKATLSRVLSERELTHLQKTIVCGQSVSSVLVAGAGRYSRGSESVFLEALESSAKAFFVDVNRSRGPDVTADLTCAWPFRESVFDLIVSTWVVEHVVNPEIFFHEAFRVLREKGTFICAVPFIYHKHDAPFDYWRFTDTALVYLAHLPGFKEVGVRPVGGSPFVSCVSLLWPVLRLPLMGFLLFLVGWLLDTLLWLVVEVTGKGRNLVNTYPINNIVIATK